MRWARRTRTIVVFEVGDIALNGVEVGAVGREEQHLVPLLGGDGLRACFLWNEALYPMRVEPGRSALHRISRVQLVGSRKSFDRFSFG